MLSKTAPEGLPAAVDLGIAHGSGFRDCPWLSIKGLPMALDVAQGFRFKDLPGLWSNR
jgi:hypothetical protein